jgi:hypothetical protein
MDVTSAATKSLKLPIFTDEIKYAIWWTRFTAYAGVFGFAAALRIGGEADMPISEDESIDVTTTDGKLKAAAKKRNTVAMCNFTLAFETEVMMAFIYESYSDEWPGGLAHLVVVALNHRFKPQDTMTRVQLRVKLSQVSMTLKDNPATIFEQLSVIKNQYCTMKQKIEEEDLIAIVISAAPKFYQTLLATEQLRLGSNIKIDDMRTAMNTLWRSIDGSIEKTSDDSEIVLGALAGIVCFICKQKGHKSHQCPNKKFGGNNNERGNQRGRAGSTGKFTGKCNNCGMVGHMYANCWEREENKNKRPANYKSKRNNGEQGNASIDGGSKIEYLLATSDGLMSFPLSQKMLTDIDVWVADSAASVHTSPHDDGMTDVEEATDEDAITVGNGASVEAVKIGKISGMICDKHGNELNATTLLEVTHLPEGKFNLFSLSKMMKDGWTLGGNYATGITIQKGNKKVTFDLKINTRKGVVFAVYLKRNKEVANVMTDIVKHMGIMEAHDKIGHGDERSTRKAAEALDIVITRGTMQPCEACTIAKAKQKNVPKESEHVKAIDGERRIFLDISTIKKVKNGPSVTKPNWRIMVDEKSSLKFSEFFQTKDGMVEPTCEQLHKWKEAGIPVKFIRMDNAGENGKLQARAQSSDWKLNITCEYTARDTPQQNHLAELGFASLANKGRALMVRGNTPLSVRYLLCREAFKTATKLDGLMVVTVNGVSATRYVHFYGSNPAFAKHLRTWGEAGTVKIKVKATPKIGDRGVQCMMVGYANDHTGDCYRMWDANTSRVHETRDIIWLKRMYYTKPTITPEFISDMEAGESEAPNESSGESGTISEVDDSATQEPIEQARVNDDEATPTPTTPSTAVTSSGRTVAKPTRLIEEAGEITLTKAEESYYNAMTGFNFIEGGGFEIAAIGAGLGGGFENTSELHVMKFPEAMSGNDAVNWQKAVDEEHERMKKMAVWKAVLKEEIPKHAKVLTSTWAMKKKSNGTYRARLNARGYEQVDGEHYQSHSISSPVSNEVTIRIVFTLMLMAGWVGELLDVKGAFLHGDFEDEEDVYMKVPQGFESYYDPRIYVLLLLQTLYGLKQAARAFWNKLLMAFRSMGFNRSKADPCLYFDWTPTGLVVWLSWIDDCLCIGNKDGVKKAKQQMVDRFDCDIIGNMDEYVGCKLVRDYENRSLKITQPVLLQSFTDEFDLPDEKASSIPAEGGQILMPCKEEDALDDKRQAIYRTGVGKLLHMMRWSRPETLNAVRELSKHMKMASEAHLKAMYRLMKYCVETPERGLFLRPTREWDGNPEFEFVILGRSDSNYATDTSNRRSTSGYSVFLEGSPISMKSIGQKSVTLSVTEAELSAGTSCAQDMLFAMRVIESLGLKVKKPMILEMDNKGAVDLSNNWSVGGRTRHVDVKQWFLRELKEQNTIFTEWRPGASMSSDLFTKNLERPLFERHTPVYCGEDEYLRESQKESQ